MFLEQFFFFSKGRIHICSSFKDVILLGVLEAFENCLVLLLMIQHKPFHWRD